MPTLGFRRRFDFEQAFPPYMWGAAPRIYERVMKPAWKKAGYYLRDVLLPERASDLLSSAVTSVRGR